MLLDVLFPKTSLTGTEGTWITEREWKLLLPQPIFTSAAILRQRNLRWLDGVAAAHAYGEAPLLRRAIHTLKYRGVTALAEHLSELLVEAAGRTLRLPARPAGGRSGQAPALLMQGDHVLCPIPLHWLRFCQRGFNQATLLAHGVGKRTGLPVHELLRRKRWTGSQVKRTRDERLGSMHSAFCIRKTELPEAVILVDDVMTTGSTLNAAASCLKRRGVKRVFGLVLAQDL